MDHSLHFQRWELQCRCPCERCEMEPDLIRLAEKVRVVLGDIPMTSTSGFRCKKHNAAVGGHPDSFHMYGQALDFTVKALALLDAHARIIKAWERGLLPELGGIGFYPAKNFIHIDTVHASDGHLRRWTG